MARFLTHFASPVARTLVRMANLNAVFYQTMSASRTLMRKSNSRTFHRDVRLTFRNGWVMGGAMATRHITPSIVTGTLATVVKCHAKIPHFINHTHVAQPTISVTTRMSWATFHPPWSLENVRIRSLQHLVPSLTLDCWVSIVAIDTLE
jgi:hypothetical protein